MNVMGAMMIYTNYYIYTLQKSNANLLLSIIWICLWVYIRNFRYHEKACLFLFPFSILFALIISQKRRQSD